MIHRLHVYRTADVCSKVVGGGGGMWVVVSMYVVVCYSVLATLLQYKKYSWFPILYYIC